MSYAPANGIQYQLRAVVVHQAAYGSGHYVAYVRGSDDQWWFCNDRARPRAVVDAAEIQRQQAYVLFYELVSVQRPQLITALHPHAN